MVEKVVPRDKNDFPIPGWVPEKNVIATEEAGPAGAGVVKVASSASSLTLAAANLERRGLMIFNDSAQALFVKFGVTAGVADFTVKILAGGYFEIPYPCYTGRVDGIWAAADGNAYITELS